MNRLTERDERGEAYVPVTDPPYLFVTRQAVDRLAEYEDTGLEPAQIKAVKAYLENLEKGAAKRGN